MLKDRNVNCTISWEKLQNARFFKPATGKCRMQGLSFQKNFILLFPKIPFPFALNFSILFWIRNHNGQDNIKGSSGISRVFCQGCGRLGANPIIWPQPNIVVTTTCKLMFCCVHWYPDIATHIWRRDGRTLAQTHHQSVSLVCTETANPSFLHSYWRVQVRELLTNSNKQHNKLQRISFSSPSTHT